MPKKKPIKNKKRIKIKVALIFIFIFVALFICLRIFWILSISRHGFWIGNQPLKHMEVFRLIYESSSILNVSAAIIVAGLAIAAPLYIFLWQSMTDSVFKAFLDAHEMSKNQKISTKKRKKILKIRKKIFIILEELEKKIYEARLLFKWALVWALGLLVFLCFIIICSKEEIVYFLGAITIILSLGLAFLFIMIVFKVQLIGAIPSKLENQIEIAKELMKKDA